MPSQGALEVKADQPVNRRNLTLNEIVSQCRHHNHNIRRSAYTQLTEFFQTHSQIVTPRVSEYLDQLLEGILDEEKAVREAAVQSLLFVLPNLTPTTLAPFSRLCCGYCCASLSHIQSNVQKDGLTVLRALITHHPAVISTSLEQFLPNLLSMLQNRVGTSDISGQQLKDFNSSSAKEKSGAKRKKGTREYGLLECFVGVLRLHLSSLPEVAFSKDQQSSSHIAHVKLLSELFTRSNVHSLGNLDLIDKSAAAIHSGTNAQNVDSALPSSAGKKTASLTLENLREIDPGCVMKKGRGKRHTQAIFLSSKNPHTSMKESSQHQSELHQFQHKPDQFYRKLRVSASVNGCFLLDDLRNYIEDVFPLLLGVWIECTGNFVEGGRPSTAALSITQTVLECVFLLLKIFEKTVKLTCTNFGSDQLPKYLRSLVESGFRTLFSSLVSHFPLNFGGTTDTHVKQTLASLNLFLCRIIVTVLQWVSDRQQSDFRDFVDGCIMDDDTNKASQNPSIALKNKLVSYIRSCLRGHSESNKGRTDSTHSSTMIAALPELLSFLRQDDKAAILSTFTRYFQSRQPGSLSRRVCLPTLQWCLEEPRRGLIWIKQNIGQSWITALPELMMELQTDEATLLVTSDLLLRCLRFYKEYVDLKQLQLSLQPIFESVWVINASNEVHTTLAGIVYYCADETSQLLYNSDTIGLLDTICVCLNRTNYRSIDFQSQVLDSLVHNMRIQGGIESKSLVALLVSIAFNWFDPENVDHRLYLCAISCISRVCEILGAFDVSDQLISLIVESSGNLRSPLQCSMDIVCNCLKNGTCSPRFTDILNRVLPSSIWNLLVSVHQKGPVTCTLTKTLPALLLNESILAAVFEEATRCVNTKTGVEQDVYLPCCYSLIGWAGHGQFREKLRSSLVNSQTRRVLDNLCSCFQTQRVGTDETRARLKSEIALLFPHS